MKRLVLCATFSTLCSTGALFAIAACGDSSEDGRQTASSRPAPAPPAPPIAPVPPAPPATPPSTPPPPPDPATTPPPAPPIAQEPPRTKTKRPPAVPEDCGDEGEPPCPLQAWMERNTQQAVENQDLPALARALTRIAAMAPERSWNEGPNGWKPISERGAQAAQAGDFRGARASCKQCHNAWRERYRREHRLRPVPGG